MNPPRYVVKLETVVELDEGDRFDFTPPGRTRAVIVDTMTGRGDGTTVRLSGHYRRKDGGIAGDRGDVDVRSADVYGLPIASTMYDQVVMWHRTMLSWIEATAR